MLRLRVGLVVFVIVFIVRLLLNLGVAKGIKTVSADSKNVVKETTVILQQNPRNYEAYTKRGDAEYALLKPNSAIQDYTAALGILPSAQLYNKRADAYLLNGNNELAEKDRNAAKNYH